MSFNDLERGSSSGGGSGSGARAGGGSGRTPLPLYRNELGAATSSNVPPEFEALTKRIGIQIFKINSNVTAIHKLITLLSPNTSTTTAGKNGQDWSKRIHDLIETTRELVKDGTTDIKQLSTFNLSSASGSGLSAARLTQSKLQRDFQQSALQFQKTQKDAVAKTRLKLEQEKQKERQLIKQQQQAAQSHSSSSSQPHRQTQLLLDEEEQANDDDEHRFGATSPDQAQLLQTISGPSQADLEYQESLITSREAEIREIESGVQELNEIFRDLGNIVQEQGGMIDNIEFNINSIADNTAGADRELVVAHEYQRKAGRRCIVLLLVVGFVVAVVLLAALS